MSTYARIMRRLIETHGKTITPEKTTHDANGFNEWYFVCSPVNGDEAFRYSFASNFNITDIEMMYVYDLKSGAFMQRFIINVWQFRSRPRMTASAMRKRSTSVPYHSMTFVWDELNERCMQCRESWRGPRRSGHELRTVKSRKRTTWVKTSAREIESYLHDLLSSEYVAWDAC